MSGTLTILDAFSTDVVVPTPGEDVTANSVTVFAQSLANRTRWLANRGLIDRREYAVDDPGGNIQEFDTESYVTSDVVLCDFAAEVGDEFLISFFCNYTVEGGTSFGLLQVVAIDDNAGLSTGPDLFELSGARIRAAVLATHIRQATVVTSHICTIAGTTRITYRGKVDDDSDGTSITTGEALVLRVEQFRRIGTEGT